MMTKPSTHETKEPGALFPKSQKKDLCAIRGAATKLQLGPCRGEQKMFKHQLTILQLFMQDLNFSRLCHQLHLDYTHHLLSVHIIASMQHSNGL